MQVKKNKKKRLYKHTLKNIEQSFLGVDYQHKYI